MTTTNTLNAIAAIREHLDNKGFTNYMITTHEPTDLGFQGFSVKDMDTKEVIAVGQSQGKNGITLFSGQPA